MAEELAEAMETRGFGRSGRTFLTEFRFRMQDRLALAAGLAFTAAWVWKVVL
jgi:energy-coupling factor transporter transmembrane protein EcfT